MATQQPILFASNDTGNNSATEYNFINARASSWTATRTNTETVIPTNGTFKELNLIIAPAPGAGTSWKFTLFVNGVASTSLTGSISDTANTLTVPADQSISAQDVVAIECDPTNTPTAFTSMSGSVIWEPTIDDEYIILGGDSDTISSSSTEYNFLENSTNNWNSTAGFRRQVFPVSGTLKKLAVTLNGSPGAAPNAFAFTINEQTSGDTSITVSCTDADFSQIDTSSHSVTAGELYGLKVAPTSSPTSQVAKWGCVFVPDTTGQIPILAGTTNPLHSTSTEYNVFTQSMGWTSTESSVQTTLENTEFTVIAHYVVVDISPSGGDSILFSLRKNTATEAAADLTIATGETAKNVTGLSIDFVDGDAVNVLVNPDGGIGSSTRAYYSYAITFGEPAGPPATFTPRMMVY